MVKSLANDYDSHAKAHGVNPSGTSPVRRSIVERVFTGHALQMRRKVIAARFRGVGKKVVAPGALMTKLPDRHVRRATPVTIQKPEIPEKLLQSST